MEGTLGCIESGLRRADGDNGQTAEQIQQVQQDMVNKRGERLHEFGIIGEGVGHRIHHLMEFLIIIAEIGGKCKRGIDGGDKLDAATKFFVKGVDKFGCACYNITKLLHR